MDELRMSAHERIRLDAMKRIDRKELTVAAAAELIDLSLRQTRRLWKRFKADGDAGLVHRLRDRAGNRRLGDADRQRIVKRHQDSYADFGPTFACEKLAEEGLCVSPNTLTALLKERGLWQRRRRRGRHRQRRQRRACFGSMIQMDDSHHDWFEGRGPWCVLMVMIDDATNNAHELLVIGMDGGRVQTREKNQENGSRWKEDKVLTVTSLPQRRWPGEAAAEAADDLPGDDGRCTGLRPAGRMEADRRGIRQAACVIGIHDGGNWNDPLWQERFGCHPRILDYYHAAEHLHEGALRVPRRRQGGRHAHRSIL